MEIMELQVIEKVLPSITTNVEVLEGYVRGLVKGYENTVVTEDDYKDWKKTVADLNKVKKEIDDNRKAIKEELSKPISEFEVKMKQITAVIDEVTGDLKSQITTFEQKQRVEKETALLQYAKEQIETRGLPLDYFNRVMIDNKFIQISATIKSGKESIDTQLNMFIELDKAKAQGIETIKTMCNTMSMMLEVPLDTEKYLNRFDGTNLNDIVRLITTDQTRQMQVEQQTKERAKAKAEEEARRKIEMEQRMREQVRVVPENTVIINQVEIEVEQPIEIKDGNVVIKWLVSGASGNISALREYAKAIDVQIKDIN